MWGYPVLCIDDMNPPSPVVTCYVAQAHQPPTGRGGAGDAAAASRGGAPRGGAGGAEGGEGDAAERAAAQRPWDGALRERGDGGWDGLACASYRYIIYV